MTYFPLGGSHKCRLNAYINAKYFNHAKAMKKLHEIGVYLLCNGVDFQLYLLTVLRSYNGKNNVSQGFSRELLTCESVYFRLTVCQKAVA